MQLPDSLRSDRLSPLSRFVVHAAGAPRHTGVAPFTGEPTLPLPVSTPDDVATAFERARRAQRGWAARSLAERCDVLRRVHRLALQRREALIDVVQWESGKARLHAFEEVVDVAINASYYARTAARHLVTQRVRGWIPGVTAVSVGHPPKGVVGLITPWNYPLTLPISDALPALAAGNAVVIKPDWQTPFSTLSGVQLLVDSGLPEDLFLVVIGDGPDLGPALVEHADFVGFTGSTDVGRLIARQAGQRLVETSLELGGKNAQLVLPDTNPRKAALGSIRSLFASAGQLCVSMERVYVHDSVYDEYVAALVKVTESLRIGASFGYDTDLGSLVSEAQLHRVHNHVEDAVSKGATLLTGGKPLPEFGPYFFAPTLLTDVNESMMLCRNETFGPVAAISRVRSVDEAVAAANDSEFGLSACIWTRDVAQGRRVARRLRSGTVSINEAYGAFWGSIAAPMGGIRNSGQGHRHGREGIVKYTDIQTVGSQRWMGFGAPPLVSQRAYALAMTSAIRALSKLGRP